MLLEIGSRLLAVIAVAAFALVFVRGRLPVIPPGRWTVSALFALGLAMCTVAGTRDGIGPDSFQPAWLATTFTALGMSAMTVLLATLVGLPWRLGAAALAVVIGLNWLLALAYAIGTGLETVPSGVLALAVAMVVVIGIAWTTPRHSAVPQGAS